MKKPLHLVSKHKRISNRPSVAEHHLPPYVSSRPSHSETEHPLSDFMVPAQDAHGHSVKVIFRCVPAYKRQIEIIISSKEFPFETESDLARWCLSRGLRMLSAISKKKEAPSYQAIIATWEHAAEVEMEYAKMGKALGRIYLAVRKLIEEDHHGPARKILLQVQERLDGIDDDYWRELYRDKLLGDFGAFLGGSLSGG